MVAFAKHPTVGKSVQVWGASSLAPSPDGSVFTITQQGFLRVHQDSIKQWIVEPALPADRKESIGLVAGVIVRPNGSVVYGCGAGVCEGLGEKIRHWGSANGLAKDGWGFFVLPTVKALSGCVVRNTWPRSPLLAGIEEHDLPCCSVNLISPSMAVDPEGRVLAAYENQLARLEGGQWRLFSQKNGLLGESIQAVLVDREGSPWIAYPGFGLHRWLGYGHWEHWTRSDGLQSNTVWAILRDHSGTIWVGDEHGLVRKKSGDANFESFNLPGLRPNATQTIAETRDGSLWLSRADAKVIQIGPRSARPMAGL